METAQTQLKAWVQREGRKLSWLARQVPVGSSHLSRWMQGHVVPREIYRVRLAEITGLNIAGDAEWRAGLNEGKDHD